MMCIKLHHILKLIRKVRSTSPTDNNYAFFRGYSNLSNLFQKQLQAAKFYQNGKKERNLIMATALIYIYQESKDQLLLPPLSPPVPLSPPPPLPPECPSPEPPQPPVPPDPTSEADEKQRKWSNPSGPSTASGRPKWFSTNDRAGFAGNG